ncbi:energy-coupling factor transporter transmembrane component T [Bacillus sp. PS06]|uniref:energy-coupling factor transporter transmembrane component T n=1 Tax=Bacillus sp. PS06 TaxID=2764176 RepID=UPI0017820BFA|nr:energy-coupling factor transporter transmembrane component T [Bacillus sp. PS06]MBD8070297.1 energy-coupling factor transporter transmembrane protein EcfT [Bacillus sp. PS06]
MSYFGNIPSDMNKKYLRFHGYHPFTNLCYFIGLIALASIISHPLYLAFYFFLLLVLFLIFQQDRKLKAWVPYFFLMFLFILIMNPLMNKRGTHILFYLGDQSIMLEGVIYGIRMGLSLMCILFIFFLLNVVLNDLKLFYLFGRIAPKSALLSILTMRFVPLLRRRLAEIMMVQSRRGVRTDKGKIKNKLKHGIILLQVLLTWSLEDAIQTADSMKARGYENKEKTYFHRFQMTKQDYLALLVLLTLFILTMIGMITNSVAQLQIYPSLEPFDINRITNFYMVPFILYIWFPIVIEIKEWIKWKYSG